MNEANYEDIEGQAQVMQIMRYSTDTIIAVSEVKSAVIYGKYAEITTHAMSMAIYEKCNYRGNVNKQLT